MRAARVVNPATAALLVQTVRNLLFNAKGDCDGGPPRRASCSRMTATRSSAVEAARPSPSSTPSLPSRRPSIGDAADWMQRFSTFPQHCELLLLFRGQNEWITWSRFLKFLIGAGNDPPSSDCASIRPTIHPARQIEQCRRRRYSEPPLPTSAAAAVRRDDEAADHGDLVGGRGRRLLPSICEGRRSAPASESTMLQAPSFADRRMQILKLLQVKLVIFQFAATFEYT